MSDFFLRWRAMSEKRPSVLRATHETVLEVIERFCAVQIRANSGCPRADRSGPIAFLSRVQARRTVQSPCARSKAARVRDSKQTHFSAQQGCSGFFGGTSIVNVSK